MLKIKGMVINMYNPIQLENEFEHYEHGKSRMSAMRSAIHKADEHNDLKYQIGFRLDLCYESQFYDDSFDSLIVFPEVLALIDKQPDIILDYSIYLIRENGMDRVLYMYKLIIGNCDDFYQIPYDDCMKYFDDFKKRSISFGYNLKPYYKNMYYFYRKVDEELAKKYFLSSENCQATTMAIVLHVTEILKLNFI